MKANDVEKAKAAAIALLRKARIAVTRCELETMEVADLVKGDGLSLYHSGDYLGPVDGCEAGAARSPFQALASAVAAGPCL